MKHLLVTDNDPAAGSWYRGIFAHAALGKRHRKEVMISAARQPITEERVSSADAMAFFRPCYKQDLELLDLAAHLEIKTCSDWDDSMFDVPYSHPDYPMWSNEALLNCWVQCLQRSTIITTTTSHLVKEFSKITKKDNVYLIPNAIDDAIIHHPTAPKLEDAPRTIIWRGGKTHSEDLASFKEVFRILQKEQVRIIFFGSLHPFSVKDVLIDGLWSHIGPFSPVPVYWKMLRELNAPVHVIPLTRDKLNLGKSNIAWLEGSYIGGSACLYPDFFNADVTEPGVASTYDESNSAQDIADAVIAMLETPSIREKIVTNAQRIIKERYLSSVVDESRIKLYKEHIF